MRASAQHSASVRAIAARQLQALVRRRGIDVRSARFSAATSAGGQDGGQKGSVQTSAHDCGEADRLSCVKAASRDLSNVRERYALFFAPVVAAPATPARIAHERRLLNDNPRAVGPGDAQLRWLASR